MVISEVYHKEYANTNYGKNPNNFNEEEWGVPVRIDYRDSITQGQFFK